MIYIYIHSQKIFKMSKLHNLKSPKAMKSAQEEWNIYINHVIVIYCNTVL